MSSAHPFSTSAAVAASFALLASLAGCAPQLDAAVFMTAPPAPADHPVRVYRGQAPECAYEELGLLIWKRSGWDELQEGVEAMRVRAAEMGGDAIVAFDYGVNTAGMRTTTTADSASVRSTSSIVTQAVASGTVVRFTDRSCAVTALRVAS